MRVTSESSKCWFVSNVGVEDKGAEPKFLHRSLATLKVHLKNTRVATTKRIRDEYDRRAERIKAAAMKYGSVVTNYLEQFASNS